MGVKQSRQSELAPVEDPQLTELLQQFGRTMAALKRAGRPVPEVIERAAASERFVGPRHGRVLLAVALERDLSVSQLAERLGLGVPVTSQMVGELSRAGLLERSEDERDRRRTLVRLNPDHAEEIERWMVLRITPLRRTLERLSPVARKHFVAGWHVLAEEMQALVEGGDSP
jgi:DNA-binding MarR family transcriptional regulator